MKYKNLTPLSVLALCASLFSAQAFAALASGTSGGSMATPESRNTDSNLTSAQTRSLEKANSTACAKATAYSNQVAAANRNAENLDASSVSLYHDSTGAHTADTRHADMVQSHQEQEAANEKARQLACGVIDDGKSETGQTDDATKESQYNSSNSTSENGTTYDSGSTSTSTSGSGATDRSSHD